MSSARRPLTTRDMTIAKNCAVWLSQRAITPNQISLLSLVFAFIASVCLLGSRDALGIDRWLLPLFGAVFIQLRLLCNLFDGMVAIEGGKHSRSGELFNDIPDRFADSMILVAAGYAVTTVSWGWTLGWCAALFAVMTAYIRTLAVSSGAPADFQGPMAKPHRMAVLTLACLAAMVESVLNVKHYAFLLALMIIILGCLLTLYRRITAAYHYLEKAHEA